MVTLMPLSGSSGGPDDFRLDVRYEVETILDRRGYGAETEFEVRWKGYPVTTWEPADNLDGADKALRDFERRQQL